MMREVIRGLFEVMKNNLFLILFYLLVRFGIRIVIR